MAVTGASVTAGYGLSTPPIQEDLGAYPINMKHIMEGIITVPHEEVEFFGKLMFFTNPKAYGDEFIAKINEYEPSLLIGIDFLFWFAHGSTPEGVDVTSYRLVKLDYGLSLLDQVNCPIIVGNLPNIESAIENLLSRHQVPTQEVLAQLNERIEMWAQSKPNVRVIDAYHLWNLALKGEEFTVLDTTWPNGSQSRLLQDDMLHTTLEGTVAACLLVIEKIPERGVETNLEIIMKRAEAAARRDK